MNTLYKVYPGVELGSDAEIGAYAVIGLPPRGKKPGEQKTYIGSEATIRSHTVIYAGNRIGHHFQSGHGVMIREENDIGDYVSIGTASVVEHHVRIGHHVRIHSQAFIPEYSVLESGCWIGPNVVLTNALHPLCPKAKECLKGPTIREGAKIGANATLLPDIEIGLNALVGAGSVVVEDVPAGAVVAGNPARSIKMVEELNCPFGLMERPY